MQAAKRCLPSISSIGCARNVIFCPIRMSHKCKHFPNLSISITLHRMNTRDQLPYLLLAVAPKNSAAPRIKLRANAVSVPSYWSCLIQYAYVAATISLREKALPSLQSRSAFAVWGFLTSLHRAFMSSPNHSAAISVDPLKCSRASG